MESGALQKVTRAQCSIRNSAHGHSLPLHHVLPTVSAMDSACRQISASKYCSLPKPCRQELAPVRYLRKFGTGNRRKTFPLFIPSFFGTESRAPLFWKVFGER